MKGAVALLRELTRLAPPALGCAHAISLRANGSVHIHIAVRYGRGFHGVDLDAADLERSPADLATEIMAVCAAPSAPPPAPCVPGPTAATP